MAVRGPLHAFHLPDSSDDPARARAWASRSARRALVLAGAFLMIVLGLTLGVVMDSIFAFIAAGSGRVGAETWFPGFALLVLAVVALWTDRALFLASRPAFALADEPYDERQAGLNARARSVALIIALVVVILLTAIGASPAPAGYVLGAGIAGFALVMSAQQMVLAWALPASEFDYSGEEDPA